MTHLKANQPLAALPSNTSMMQEMALGHTLFEGLSGQPFTANLKSLIGIPSSPGASLTSILAQISGDPSQVPVIQKLLQVHRTRSKCYF